MSCSNAPLPPARRNALSACPLAGGSDPDSIEGSGDVKYHLGASGVRRTSAGKEIIVSVAFNPSHLEAVDPVVEGITRPTQDRLGDAARERVIPVLIHGDAAMAGQGTA